MKLKEVIANMAIEEIDDSSWNNSTNWWKTSYLFNAEWWAYHVSYRIRIELNDTFCITKIEFGDTETIAEMICADNTYHCREFPTPIEVWDVEVDNLQDLYDFLEELLG